MACPQCNKPHTQECQCSDCKGIHKTDDVKFCCDDCKETVTMLHTVFHDRLPSWTPAT